MAVASEPVAPTTAGVAALSHAPGKISLHEYSTFQYMLAPPSIAVRVGDQITGVVFYDEPKQPDKREVEHKMFIETTGYLRLSSYYICCLLVLPSHVMGMSRFVSAEDLSGAKTLEENNVLRHFVYTYYCGLLKVDTYHIRDANGGAEAFRLVEYFNTWWFCTYAIMVPFYALFGPLLLVFSLPFYFFLRLVACLNRISEECLSQKNQV